MTDQKTAVLVCCSERLGHDVASAVGACFRLVSFATVAASLDFIYNALPDLIIASADGCDTHEATLLNDLKTDPIFGQIPIIAVFATQPASCVNAPLIFDDFVTAGRLSAELAVRVDLCLGRNERVVEVNPLTRLPGNIAITRQIQTRLDRGAIFGLAYADLDHFKPFNDRYGFSRGDEILRMTGRLLMNTVRSIQAIDSFSGHIGGDDFVFIMEPELIERAAAELIRHFDGIMPTFYDAADRAARGIESVDREGTRRRFPLIGISIGIATNCDRPYAHYGQIAETASEMKKYAKQTEGSCFRCDRRRSP